LPATGIVDQATAALINREGEQLQPTPAKPFVVKGRVVHADGKPLLGSLVRAFDRDLRSEEPLGEATAGPYDRTDEADKPDDARHVDDMHDTPMRHSSVICNVGMYA
jgi:hypothetical protein